MTGFFYFLAKASGMQIEFFPAHTFDNERYKYAVIVTFFNEQLVCVRHKDRETWEIPGGRREAGELILTCAARELEEETGAFFYFLEVAFDYAVSQLGMTSYGSVFLADVFEFDVLPDFEIAEIAFFDQLPKNLTYPEIQPLLLGKVLDQFRINFPKLSESSS